MGAPTQIRDHTMAVELRVALSAGSVHERRHRHARGCSLPFAVDLLAGRPRPPLQEVEGHRHRLHVGDGRGRGHLRAGEGPQQRHRFGCRERHVERRHAALRPPGQQVPVGLRCAPAQHGPEGVGIDDPHQAELVGQVAVPDAGRLPGADVVVVDAEGDLPDQVFGVGELRDRQHDARPGPASPEGWQMSVGRWGVVFRGLG